MITKKFYLDEAQDADILEWLESHPKGDRSAIIRDTLRRGIGQHSGPALDLGAIRQVIESALDARLLSVGAPAQKAADDETAELLNDLDSNLLLE